MSEERDPQEVFEENVISFFNQYKSPEQLEREDRVLREMMFRDLPGDSKNV